MSKNKLLDTAMKMDIEKKYESFYRFAHTYLFHMRQRNESTTDELFEAIKYCKDHSDSVASRIGVTGNDTERIVKWCEYIICNDDLRSLSLNELDYVFACCAHLCKAK